MKHIFLNLVTNKDDNIDAKVLSEFTDGYKSLNNKAVKQQIESEIMANVPDQVIPGTYGEYIYGCVFNQSYAPTPCTPSCIKGLVTEDTEKCRFPVYIRTKHGTILMNNIKGAEGYLYIDHNDTSSNTPSDEEKQMFIKDGIKNIKIYRQHKDNIDYKNVANFSLNLSNDDSIELDISRSPKQMNTSSSRRGGNRTRKNLARTVEDIIAMTSDEFDSDSDSSKKSQSNKSPTKNSNNKKVNYPKTESDSSKSSQSDSSKSSQSDSSKSSQSDPSKSSQSDSSKSSQSDNCSKSTRSNTCKSSTQFDIRDDCKNNAAIWPWFVIIFLIIVIIIAAFFVQKKWNYTAA